MGCGDESARAFPAVVIPAQAGKGSKSGLGKSCAGGGARRFDCLAGWVGRLLGGLNYTAETGCAEARLGSRLRGRSDLCPGVGAAATAWDRRWPVCIAIGRTNALSDGYLHRLRVQVCQSLDKAVVARALAARKVMRPRGQESKLAIAILQALQNHTDAPRRIG